MEARAYKTIRRPRKRVHFADPLVQDLTPGLEAGGEEQFPPEEPRRRLTSPDSSPPSSPPPALRAAENRIGFLEQHIANQEDEIRNLRTQLEETRLALTEETRKLGQARMISQEHRILALHVEKFQWENAKLRRELAAFNNTARAPPLRTATTPTTGPGTSITTTIAASAVHPDPIYAPPGLLPGQLREEDIPSTSRDNFF